MATRRKVRRRRAIPLSGDGLRFPPLPAADLSLSAVGRGRFARALSRLADRRDTVLGLGLLVAILAIVPLGLATWAFGRAYGASETGRSDARLVAAARLALNQTASGTAVPGRGA